MPATRIRAATDGWPGPAISAAEQLDVLAAFNGGFRLNLGLGGFLVLGRGAGTDPARARVGRHLCRRHVRHRRLGHATCRHPARTSSASGRTSACSSTAGQPAADVDEYGPWGATLGGGFAVARSGLGIDRYGNLLWAGSTYATPRAIAMALIQSGAVRAMQLDINPMWVGAFTFPNAVLSRSVLPGQYNGLGTYLNALQPRLLHRRAAPCGARRRPEPTSSASASPKARAARQGSRAAHRARSAPAASNRAREP